MRTRGSSLCPGLLLGGALAILLLVPGCEGTLDLPPGPCEGTASLLAHLRVDRAQGPTPVLEGTSLIVRGEGFVVSQSCVVPEVVLVGGTDGVDREVVLQAEVNSPNELVATLAGVTPADLGGSGSFRGELEVRFVSVDDGRVFSSSAPLGFFAADGLRPRLDRVGADEVYLEDAVSVEGDGFLFEGEGRTEVLVEGSCTDLDSGATRTVSDLYQPAASVGVLERDRATFPWAAAICGLAPSSFSGRLTPINRLASGAVDWGDPVAVDLEQLESILFEISPVTFSLGEVVELHGRGFVGGSGQASTTVRLEGTFTPASAGARSIAVELVASWVDGGTLRYPVVASAEGGELRSVDFGATRGRFTGTAVPVLTLGTERREGLGQAVSLTLGPVRQVVWVRFLPGFEDSLELFGLGALDEEVRRRILVRMADLYSGINVEFRAEEPDDVYEGAYTILDIGGPDPNNLGLLGYDNEPGKDVGNLRLHDHLGGENALGALDGLAYGGVFIESLLYWSQHPPLGPRPPAAPPPEPRFDEIFDPLRSQEVVASEWPSGANPTRLAQIEVGIHALSSMVADTAAHELGHSLGLAQPYGSPTAFHNNPPGDGCLMDSGSDRPFVERARIDGSRGARFCGENLVYLGSILPTD